MSKVFKCHKCGKEFSYGNAALDNWASTKARPEQIKCPDCFGKPSSKASTAKASTESVAQETKKPAYNPVSSKPAYKKASSTGKVGMSAELLKAKYDELCAVFGDNLDEVKDYLGGWTTTLALSETR